MSYEQVNPLIEVTPHGPYEVSGDVALRKKSIVRSAEGEAMTWKIEEELEHPSTYYLCRCGQSQNKPFCDGTHAFDLFDGTETASTNLSEERGVVHEGTDIKVIRDEELCRHAGFCSNSVWNWSDMVADTDDRQVRVQLIGIIEHCPSSALANELHGERIEPDLPVVIAPETDGPYVVTGGVTIARSDGEPIETRNRMCLCRCGESSNKPFCDGTHYEIGFEA